MYGKDMHCLEWPQFTNYGNRLLKKILQSSGKKDNFPLVILIIKLLITSFHLLV